MKKTNNIYRGLIGECEKIEHAGTYRGNGHHLAQRLTHHVTVHMLPRKQSKVYWAIDEKKWMTAAEIAKEAGVHSKEVSIHVKQMNSEFEIVETKKEKGKTLYKQAPVRP